jgi:lysophospholipase L1-like esterase
MNMTRVILVAVFIIAITWACGGGKNWWEYPYYIERSTELSNHEGYCEAVIIGDSRVQEGKWEEYKNTWCNFGIGGDTATGISHRLAAVINKNPKNVVVQVGYNDIYMGLSPEFIAGEIKTIASILTVEGIDVYITSTLMCKNDSLNKLITILNDLLKEYCMETSVVFVDVNKLLAPDGYLINEIGDGVHLSESGYDIFYEIIHNNIY